MNTFILVYKDGSYAYLAITETLTGTKKELRTVKSLNDATVFNLKCGLEPLAKEALANGTMAMVPAYEKRIVYIGHEPTIEE